MQSEDSPRAARRPSGGARCPAVLRPLPRGLRQRLGPNVPAARRPAALAAAPVTEAVPIATTEPEPEPEAPQLTERQKEIARLRAAEKFLEKDTGKYMCKVCEYQSVRKSNSESGAPENSSRSPFSATTRP